MNKEGNFLYFISYLDEIIEKVQLERLNIDEFIKILKEELKNFTQLSDLFLLIKDENLEYRFFYSGEKLSPEIEKEFLDWANKGFYSLSPQVDKKNYIWQLLDLAGNIIGILGFIYTEPFYGIDISRERKFLYLTCEVLDNYLAEYFFDNLKHHLELKIASILEEKILFNGLEKCVRVLQNFIDFDTFFIFYFDKFNIPNYFLYSRGKTHDSFFFPSPELDNLFKKENQKLLKKPVSTFLKDFQGKNFQEEFIIEGIASKNTIGKFAISSSISNFNNFERKILDIFLSILKHRILDFNREWMDLSRHFSTQQILKLLEDEEYEKKYLSPRTKKVAILYADLSSFTFFSEFLNSPHLITELINVWAKRAIHLIWKHQGCFDKLLGDCVIGLFGPPFFEGNDQKNIKNAVNCALEIKKMTLELLNSKYHSLQLINNSPHKDRFGVAMGINWGKVNVGLLGPGKNFTCFGSVMNNAARLQDKAKKGEILIFDSPFQHIKDNYTYHGPFKGQFKNVSGEVAYYEIIDSK